VSRSTSSVTCTAKNIYRYESTNTDEVNTGIRSPDILAENHNTQDESVLVCLSYDQLREKLAHTEAALFKDLREAAQVIYEAVWADPSPAEPSRTYENAAQALLLNELRHRAVPAWCGY
jgi:hypothetical protein